MAGYLFNFSDEESLFDSIKSGTYSTLMNLKWDTSAEGTLGDYATMRPGDNVYFFSKRNVYGIGELVETSCGDIVLENFDGATSCSTIDYAFVKLDPLISDPIVEVKSKGKSTQKVKRWSIFFKPSPYFFTGGIDMDDLLSSDDYAFKSLRVFWKRSFIKLDDAENQAFKTAFLRRNLSVLEDPSENDVFRCEYKTALRHVDSLKHIESRKLQVPQLMASLVEENGELKHEMLLEVGMLYQLSNNDENTCNAFGTWDYLSHQVPASPMKAVDYMDKIDVFGYRWIPGYKPIIEKYMIAELKRGCITGDDLQQVMKYIDWYRNEYTSGDYSILKAFLVGHEFDMPSICKQIRTITRYYTLGCRPAEAHQWNDLTFVQYSVRPDGHIVFTPIIIDNWDDLSQ